MKKIIEVSVCVLLLAWIASPVKAETITANSAISKATVYPGSARVTRTSQLNLTPGT
ncbi:MAG: hypothetical protein JNN05_08955, partial [Candidatus Omnitrophica bacterium]|nr:hypothetical protein [Candidatus Omnitrophota bacterium]